MVKLRVLRANDQHAMDFAGRLSFLDRREMSVYSPDTHPREALLEGVRYSKDARVLLQDDVPLAMWGVIEATAEEGEKYGMPWLLSAEPADYTMSAKKALIKNCKASIKHWHSWFETLQGFSWAKAVEHHKLLQNLGFELSDVITENSRGQTLAAPTIMFCRDLHCLRTGEKYYV